MAIQGLTNLSQLALEGGLGIGADGTANYGTSASVLVSGGSREAPMTWLAISSLSTLLFPLKAPDGSAAAPSYSYSSDATTGGYFTTGALNWSIGGVNSLSLTTSNLTLTGQVLAATTGLSVFCSDSATNSQTLLRLRGTRSTSPDAAVTTHIFSMGTTAVNRTLAQVNVRNTTTDATTTGGRYTISTSNTAGTLVEACRIDENQVATFSGQLIGKGTAATDSAAAGYIGEYIESVVTAQNAGSTGVWTNLTSISLTAGDWDVSGLLSVDGNGAVITNNRILFAISVNSGTTTTDQVIGSNQTSAQTTSVAGAESGCAIPVYRLSLSTTTIIYFKTNATYATATPQLYGRLSARRMR